MAKRNLFVAIAIFILLASAAVPAQVTGIPQFSADMKTSAPGGHHSTGKMYWGGSKVRMDMSAEGQEVIMIHDPAKKVSYMIMPQQKMYMEMGAAGMGRMARTPDVKPYDVNNPCAGEAGTTCKKVGTETVNARSCDKWEFSGQHGKQTVWVDQKLHFPIRTVSSDGGSMDISNVKEGAQPASLFTVPAGYQKMDMGGMMGRPPRE